MTAKGRGFCSFDFRGGWLERDFFFARTAPRRKDHVSGGEGEVWHGGTTIGAINRACENVRTMLRDRGVMPLDAGLTNRRLAVSRKRETRPLRQPAPRA